MRDLPVPVPSLPSDGLGPGWRRGVTQTTVGGPFVVRGNPFTSVIDLIRGWCVPVPTIQTDDARYVSEEELGPSLPYFPGPGGAGGGGGSPSGGTGPGAQCPTGQIWSTDLSQCIPESCPAGQDRDPATGSCVDLPPDCTRTGLTALKADLADAVRLCNVAKIRALRDRADSCRVRTVNADLKADWKKVADDATADLSRALLRQCSCPTGYVYDSVAQQCATAPPPPPPDPTQCPPGEMWNGSACVSRCQPEEMWNGSACVPRATDCPPGTPKNRTGQCLPECTQSLLDALTRDRSALESSCDAGILQGHLDRAVNCSENARGGIELFWYGQRGWLSGALATLADRCNRPGGGPIRQNDPDTGANPQPGTEPMIYPQPGQNRIEMMPRVLDPMTMTENNLGMTSYRMPLLGHLDV